MSYYDEEDYNEDEVDSGGSGGGDNSGGDFGGNFQNNNKNNLGNKIKNKATQKVKNEAKKAVAKAGKKALNVAVKVAVNVIGAILKFIIATLGPYLLVILGIVILLYSAWDIIFNSRGLRQDFQSEDVNEYNKVTLDQSTGEVKATDLSTGNKLTKAFYTYFAEKSLYVTVTDKNGNVTQKDPLQYNSPDFIAKYGEGAQRKLKDKYEREKMFYLNPNALWSLDEFLHETKFRYPEQFIKPVYHDPETFALKDLTDKDGKLVVKSNKYSIQTSQKQLYAVDETDGKLKPVYKDAITGGDTFSPTASNSINQGVVQNTLITEPCKSMMVDPSNEKEAGVWDYGFGSIINYKEFEEEREGRGMFKNMNLWDVEEEKMLYGIDIEEARIMCESNPERYEGYDSNYAKDKEFVDKLESSMSYMIDRVTSPAGFVSNDIKCEWRDTGKPYLKIVKIDKEVSVWREHEKQVMKTDPSNPYHGDKPVYVDPNGNDTFNTHFKKIIVEGQPEVPPTSSLPGSPAVEEVFEMIANKPKMEKYMKKEKITKTFEFEGIGTEHENIPRYEGDPDLGGVTGSKYFIDYMTNYESFVPHNVMANLGINDFTRRTGADHEQLLKLLERQSFSGATVGKVDLESFEFGSGSQSQNVLKAMEHYDLFLKWGETYGVDPMLLIAKASQESSGVHNPNSSPACGIMQIEKPGEVIKGVSAYNHVTKQMEEFPIPNREAVASVSENIRAGAMIQASRMKGINHNMLAGLQSYNFGTGAFKLAVEKYASDNGKEYDAVINDISDIGWIPYIADFHANPNASYYLNGSWNSNNGVVCNFNGCPSPGGTNHYGDPIYLQNVLRYYVSQEDSLPWVMKEDGTKVSMNGSELSIGGGTPGGVNDSWIKRLWKDIFGRSSDIFPKMTPENMKESTAFSHKLPKNQAEITHKMMFVMEEQKLLSEYEDYDDTDWKAKFDLWFSNPIGTKWKGKGGLVDSKGIFPDGFTKPLTFSPLTIDKVFELPKHSGIDIVAPVGTNVVAISDGEVIELNKSGSKGRGKYIEIKHSSGAKTIYGGLSEINVSKGDKVRGGQVIGKTGNTHERKNVLYLELNYQGKTIDPTWIISGNFNAEDYNMTAEDAEIIQDIITLAHTKIGCEYTQALDRRSGPNSFDCSGFTWWLYKTRTGENIGANTWGQDTTLSNYRVSADSLQPGDILMPNDLHHVVLYIGKENGMDVAIHASDYGVGVIKSRYNNITSIYPKVYRPIAYVRAKQGQSGGSNVVN